MGAPALRKLFSLALLKRTILGVFLSYIIATGNTHFSFMQYTPHTMRYIKGGKFAIDNHYNITLLSTVKMYKEKAGI